MDSGLLHVVGLHGGRGLARGQRGGRAGVGGESPTAADSLVYHASQQRVPIAHAARGPQWTKKVALGQSIQCRKRFRQGKIGGRGDQYGLGDVGHDRHGARHLKVDVAERGQFRGQRGRAFRVRVTGKRFQIQRVAGRGVVACAVEIVADELPRLVEGERPQLDLLDTVGKCGRQSRWRLSRAVRRDDHHAGPRRMPDQVVEQLQRGVVGPVHVVEQQHQAGRGGQFDQPSANCTVQLVALDIDRPVDVHGGQSVARKYAERDVALELAGPSGHDRHAGVTGRGGELREQPGLAHAGLAGDPDESRDAKAGGEQLAPQQIQFVPTTHERRPDDHTTDAIADRPLWYRWKE